MNWDLLIQKAIEVRENAYAPYSKFKVGAALLTDDNSIITGCNVENVSYGLTTCAERNAVYKAMSNGIRQFKAIAIVTDTDTLTTPCGACRQVLAEFNHEMPVMLANLKGDRQLTSLKELIPYPFIESLQ
ncbi:cytidine deaminase [bacterium]|nr:cytidine deaminase [bacterium]